MPMNVVIEFYRIRAGDDAHAVIGKETADARDIGDAIEIARQLSQTLPMPQRPDAMYISDSEGNELFRQTFDQPDKPA